MREGQRIDVYRNTYTMKGKRGSLSIRERTEFVSVSNEKVPGFDFTPGVGIGTWKVVGGTGSYAKVTGGGRSGMRATPGSCAKRASSPFHRALHETGGAHSVVGAATSQRSCSENFVLDFVPISAHPLDMDVRKQRQNVASVANCASLGRPSKPVRRRSPTLGRFDSCAAPFTAEVAAACTVVRRDQVAVRAGRSNRPVRHASAKSRTAAPQKTPRAATETEAASACDVSTPEAASAAVPAPA